MKRTKALVSDEYRVEAERLARHPITLMLWATVPDDLKQQIADEEFVSGLSETARYKWHAAADTNNVPMEERPRTLGAVLDAFEVLAKEDRA
jgi:hypothetical protein